MERDADEVKYELFTCVTNLLLFHSFAHKYMELLFIE